MHEKTSGRPVGSAPTRRAGSKLTASNIADWARAHRRQTGEWPTAHSGPIWGSNGENWLAIDRALAFGGRGLPGGSSLEEFLRGYQFRPLPYPNVSKLRLSEPQVRAWAEAHFAATGRWPHQHAGVIPATGGLSWMAVDYALRKGQYGLPGGSSLTILLRKRRGSARNVHSTPLTTELILQWADAHHKRTGSWPTARSGVIQESPTNTWQAVMTALHSGYRGFKGGVTLGQFLARHRGAPLQRKCRVTLTTGQALEWADAYHARTGAWPGRTSGAIPGTSGESWASVSNAFWHGSRGLPRISLAKFLAQTRGTRATFRR